MEILWMEMGATSTALWKYAAMADSTKASNAKLVLKASL